MAKLTFKNCNSNNVPHIGRNVLKQNFVYNCSDRCFGNSLNIAFIISSHLKSTETSLIISLLNLYYIQEIHMFHIMFSVTYFNLYY